MTEAAGSPKKKGRGRRPRASAASHRPLRAELARASRDRLEYAKVLEALSSYTTSKPGKERALVLEPASDLDTILRLQDETAEIRTLLQDRFSFRLASLPDIRRWIHLDSGGLTRILSGRELAGIAFTLNRGKSIRADLSSREDLPRLSARVRQFPEFEELREKLERTVDPQGEILSSASLDLAELRREISRLDQEIRRGMDGMAKSTELRKFLQDTIVTQRNGRLVVAVRTEHRGRVRGVVHGESSSGATLFVEPQGMVRKGDELAAARQRESHEVGRIIAGLTVQINERRRSLLQLYEHLVDLDLAVARGQFGNAFDAVRPTISPQRELSIRGARHPLLIWMGRDPERGPADLSPREGQTTVVPLDLDLTGSTFQIVVTGPNTGGKTVALKTVGLYSLMAYSGLPVPAEEGAILPFYDGVYADIGDEQSLEQNLSTFSSHMTVISEILHAAGSKSLVLIDELGAGTDPLEGAALGEAVLERLYRRGTSTLVTTHLGRLKEFAFQHRKCNNACMEFDPERLAPTYRLLTGLPGRSNALIIASRIGVPQDVIQRAHELLAGEERIDEAILDGMERTRRNLERREQEMRKHQANAAKLEAKMADEVEAVRAMRRGIEHELERSEDARVGSLVERLLAATRALGTPPKEKQQAYEGLIAEIEAARRATRLAQRRLERALDLRKGDQVFVPRLRAVCDIRKVNRSKEIFTVLFNGVPTEVAYQDISWVLPPPGYEFDWYDEERG